MSNGSSIVNQRLSEGRWKGATPCTLGQSERNILKIPQSKCLILASTKLINLPYCFRIRAQHQLHHKE